MSAIEFDAALKEHSYEEATVVSPASLKHCSTGVRNIGHLAICMACVSLVASIAGCGATRHISGSGVQEVGPVDSVTLLIDVSDRELRDRLLAPAATPLFDIALNAGGDRLSVSLAAIGDEGSAGGKRDGSDRVHITLCPPPTNQASGGVEVCRLLRASADVLSGQLRITLIDSAVATLARRVNDDPLGVTPRALQPKLVRFVAK